MDVQKLADVLKATLDPNQREQAEQHLHEVHKIVGFAPILLHVVMSEQFEMPVRQAGVIYLKNMVTQFWQDREAETPGEAVPFNVHEHDRHTIRQNIVEAIIQSPEVIRVQLCVCVSHIAKYDYPGRWPDFAQKIAMYITSDNQATLMGALMCLYQLVKNYEYKRPSEREPLNQAMQHLLPIIYQRCQQLLPDVSEASNLLQKQILKIFYALTQNFLPLDLITKEMFTHWITLIRQIVDRPVPDSCNEIDEDERPELAWWKVKKWATHILARLFERYGSPGNVTKEYTQFAEWYLKSFSHDVIQVLLKVLDLYRQKIYVAPRVLQQALNYLHQGVSHAFSWKFMKPYIQNIIQEVVFPLMCHTDEDEEMWNTDPHEYIRVKYDVFEDFLSPVIAAQSLLHSSVSKRKDILQKTMGYCMQVLTTPNVNPRQKDGALHMVGAVADILLKKKMYKDQAEMMLTQHVFPEFQSPYGFLRARACWVLHYFCELRFKNEQNLLQALMCTKTCLCSDKDLPVRVEAAIALQMLITEQEKAKQHMLPHVKEVVIQLLNVIRETENDDLTSVMQKIVVTYVDEVAPLAVEMTSHLAQTFAAVLDTDVDGSEEKAITALGLLNTMETILNVMDGQPEIMRQLEGIVLNVIGTILQQNILDFYEEVLTLIYSLTGTHISNHLWQVFKMLYDMFQKDGIDYFTEMMPALHNYVTVDTPAFLSNPENLQIIYNMCKTVLTADVGEDAECHAAKLLEVVLLQCKGHVDQVVPSFVELALERLTREVRTSELRTMCLQVVIAALYYNTGFLLETLAKMHLPNTTASVTSQFLKQWLHDTDSFLGLHDRKISVLGLCSLLSTGANRPQEINEVATQMIPSMLHLFQGLKRAYANRAQDEAEEEEEEEEEDEEYEPEVLEDDDDDIDDESQQYLEKLERAEAGEDDDSDGYSDDGEDETPLETFTTPIDEEHSPVDEYIIFKSVLEGLQTQDPNWYNLLISQLTAEQKTELEEVFTLADQRKAAAESRRIEQGGGYVFTNTSVPTTFDFSSP
ncbi:importin-7-like [Liolophura sinensis]|uniref:importin-7-like n=1 Tax=Liolophura sinensis TaxID=3198878 RepID=UPI003157F5A2